jgi:hypothetical protein
LNYWFKWIKYFILKSIFHCTSQFMVFKIFTNCLLLYQWHHTTFHVKINHSTKHFSRYNTSIIIWYGLWHWVFGTSKVQYIMVTQNLFMKFVQCDHITCNIIFLNPFHILLFYILFHGPWLIIQHTMTWLDTPPNVFSLTYSLNICIIRDLYSSKILSVRTRLKSNMSSHCIKSWIPFTPRIHPT